MKAEPTLHFNPSYGLLELHLEAEEEVHIEPGSLIGMDSNLTMTSNLKGGLLNSLKRKILGGESLIINTVKCIKDSGKLFLAPACDGAIESHTLDEQGLYLQSGSFLASMGQVDVDVKWGGAKTFFSREGFFVLKASGSGKVFFNSFGAIHKIDLKNSSYIVDTGALVGWTGPLNFEVTKIGGLKSFFFSGEGLVCRFSGTGSIWIQTRNPDTLASFLHPFRRIEVRKR